VKDFTAPRGSRRQEPPQPARVVSSGNEIDEMPVGRHNPVSSKSPVPEDDGDMRTLPCPHCERHFNEDSHDKHVRICKKVFQSKRRTFDVASKRVPEELAREAKAKGGRRAAGQSSRSAKAAEDKKKAWREKSAQFRDAMKQNRLIVQYQKEGRPLSELPVAASRPDPSLIPCKGCGRTFNEQAFQKHSKICKSVFTNKLNLRGRK